jgi:hypothetical protein
MSMATGNTEDQVSVATMIALIHRSYDQKRFDGYNSDGGRHWDRDGQDGRIDRGDQGDGSNRTKSWNSDGSSRSGSSSNGPKARTQNGP